MEIIKITQDSRIREPSMIALGNFDGVHLGHQKIIQTLIRQAKLLNMKTSVLVFPSHPRNRLSGKKQLLLTSLRKKYEIFEMMGIDYIYEMDFTDEFMKLSPHDFVTSFLMDTLLVRGIVVGYDYTFGYRAMGNVEMLLELAEESFLRLEILEPVTYRGIEISSTSIRHLIRKGRMGEAAILLNRPFSVEGIVEEGKQLGRTIDIPTANIYLAYDSIVPKRGVYYGYTLVEGKKYLSAINIGINPTFENESLRLETHLFNFSGNLYGSFIEVELHKFLRDEMKFDSIDELKNQMKKDIIYIQSLDQEKTEGM